MKRKIFKLSFLSAIILISFNSFSNPFTYQEEELIQKSLKSETFKVYGNCGMCEKTIEGSLAGITEIKKADWNIETKMIEVTFDEKVITLNEIKKKIAGVGYDTDAYSASEKSYNALPGCCQYDRPKTK